MAPKTKKAHTAELVKLSAELPALIEALEVEIETVAQRMAALKKAGLIYASEFWRKDGDGTPKYFYLLYPQKPDEPRKREYVGCDTTTSSALDGETPFASTAFLPLPASSPARMAALSKTPPNGSNWTCRASSTSFADSSNGRPKMSCAGSSPTRRA